MNERRTTRLVRGIGVLLGLAIAITALVEWRIPRGTGSVGTDLMIAAAPTGELAVSPIGPVLSLTGLRPGDEASAQSATLEVRNQTGSTLYVTVRGLPSTATLDDLLWVRIDGSDGSALFRGTAGELRNWTDRGLTLVPGQSSEVSLRAWLASDATAGYEGVIENLDLEFKASVGGS